MSGCFYPTGTHSAKPQYRQFLLETISRSVGESSLSSSASDACSRRSRRLNSARSMSPRAYCSCRVERGSVLDVGSGNQLIRLLSSCCRSFLSARKKRTNAPLHPTKIGTTPIISPSASWNRPSRIDRREAVITVPITAFSHSLSVDCVAIVCPCLEARAIEYSAHTRHCQSHYRAYREVICTHRSTVV